MSTVTYRTVEREVGETGAGVDNRTEVEHQIGVTIDGVFVPFQTIAGGRVEVLQRAETDRLAAENAKTGTTKTPSSGKS